MSESVEQAALRRARAPKDADRLIALVEKIVLTVEGLNALDDSRAADIARHDDELAEIRASLLALGNRIEGLTRWHHDLRAEVQAEGDSWREAVAKGAA